MAEPLDVNAIPDLRKIFTLSFDQKKINEFFLAYQTRFLEEMNLVKKETNTEIQKFQDQQKERDEYQRRRQAKPYIVY